MLKMCAYALCPQWPSDRAPLKVGLHGHLASSHLCNLCRQNCISSTTKMFQKMSINNLFLFSPISLLPRPPKNRNSTQYLFSSGSLTNTCERGNNQNHTRIPWQITSNPKAHYALHPKNYYVVGQKMCFTTPFPQKRSCNFLRGMVSNNIARACTCVLCSGRNVFCTWPHNAAHALAHNLWAEQKICFTSSPSPHVHAMSCTESCERTCPRRRHVVSARDAMSFTGSPSEHANGVVPAVVNKNMFCTCICWA